MLLISDQCNFLLTFLQPTHNTMVPLLRTVYSTAETTAGVLPVPSHDCKRCTGNATVVLGSQMDMSTTTLGE
jgi:hypothetical protein